MKNKDLSDKSYSSFTLDEITMYFGTTLVEDMSLFSDVESRQISDYLAVTLKKFVPLAKAINTKKACSELIVAPVIAEFREMLERKISFFSGIEFNVDKHRGLKGRCDFIISLTPEQYYLKAPVINIVEAKNDNISSGLGQCISTMIASQVFNQQKGNEIKYVYGIITTGVLWQFVKLEGNTAYIDIDDYHIGSSNKLMGVLLSMIE
ncbi:MAG: hypothetical protein B6242_03940 [Anaerolineaceae bacterium 4572_78]|nr:MAG: hypothetical protein B6242_03940 [Anaerolineaceae bacterium 4572_78]